MVPLTCNAGSSFTLNYECVFFLGEPILASNIQIFEISVVAIPSHFVYLTFDIDIHHIGIYDAYMRYSMQFIRYSQFAI